MRLSLAPLELSVAVSQCYKNSIFLKKTSFSVEKLCYGICVIVSKSYCFLLIRNRLISMLFSMLFLCLIIVNYLSLLLGNATMLLM